MKKLIFLMTLLSVSNLCFAAPYVFDINVTSRAEPNIKLKINGVDCPMEGRIRKSFDQPKLIWKERRYSCFMNLSNGSYQFDLEIKSEAFLTKVESIRFARVSFPANCSDEELPYCYDTFGYPGYKYVSGTSMVDEVVNVRIGSGDSVKRSQKVYAQ